MKDLNETPRFSFFKSPVSNTNPNGELNLKEVHQLITGETYSKITSEIHSESSKEAKGNLKSKSLDYVCFSGTFTKRANKALLSYSGYLVLDFDEIGNLIHVRKHIIQDRSIDLVLLFKSPSGNGLKAVVQTDGEQEEHENFFKAYAEYFNHTYGLSVDKSGKDLSRACFLCHDPDGFIDLKQKGSLKFELQKWLSNAKNLSNNTLNADLKQVESLVLQIEESKTDVTTDYNEWVSLGFALANGLGEDGRKFYHRISRINTNYSNELTDNKFDDFLASKGQGITIGTFFHIVNKYTVDSKKKNVSNLQLAKVEEQLNANYTFRYNEIKGTIEFKSSKGRSWKIINDRFFNSALLEMKRNGLKCSADLLASLINSNFTPTFHPFKAYLKSLPDWDGNDHLLKLSQTIQVDNPEFWSLCLKKWFVAFVAGVIDNSIINHQLIVLCGAQGIGKTTWIMNLIPDELKEYIYSGTINPGNKDSLALLAEMILINLDEMDNMNRSDSGSLKSLITQKQVTYRRAYARFTETHQRIASFIGSGNEAQFLNDTTGSRRFLVFEAKDIDFKASFDFGQIYQQAVHLYKNGYKHFFDREEIALIEVNNSRYQKTSIEEDSLLKYFEPIAWDDAGDFKTATEILQYLNTHSAVPVNQNHANQIGKALSKNGFEKGKKDNNYKWAIRIKPV
ncbi:VapE domain-containing protein [Roseivirga echinicomitans]